MLIKINSLLITFEHFMWLHPSFFWIGLLQFGHGFEFVTSHKQFAASSVPLQEAFISSGFTSLIFWCHSCHCLQPEGACASPAENMIIWEKFLIYYLKFGYLDIPSRRNAHYHSRQHVKLLVCSFCCFGSNSGWSVLLLVTELLYRIQLQDTILCFCCFQQMPIFKTHSWVWVLNLLILLFPN